MRITLLAILAVLTAGPAHAQLAVAGVRDLAFGSVVTGVTTTVLATDPARSGQWTITANLGNQVQVKLTLPNSLDGPSGATMPVSFTAGDVFIQENSTGSQPDYFNPGGAKVFKFSRGTQAFIRLGGRVTPAVGQRSGAYASSALLTVTLLN